MPRARAGSIDAVLEGLISPLVRRLAELVVARIAEDVAAGLEEQLGDGVPARSLPRTTRRRPRGELTRWVADARARRVPRFVIEATGLDTKKEIVARYGPDAAFEKGEAAPPPVSAATGAPQVRARPPTIRKKAKTAA